MAGANVESPGFLFAKFGDVRNVVAAVPGILKEYPVHCERPVIGMDEHAAELIRGERTPEPNPPIMKSIEKREGRIDGTGLCVRQLRPETFVIRFNGWLLFGEREAKTDVRIEVAVRNVVNDLANGPSAFAIRRVQLRGREATGGGAKLGRSLGNNFDRLLT